MSPPRGRRWQSMWQPGTPARCRGGEPRERSLGLDVRIAYGELTELEPAPAEGGDEVAGLVVRGGGLRVPEHLLGGLDDGVRITEVPHALGLVRTAQHRQTLGAIADGLGREVGPRRLQ